MFNALKTIAAELKRANDLKEKELDLKILDRFDFHIKYDVWPKTEDKTTQVVVAPTYEQVSTSAQHPYAGFWR